MAELCRMFSRNSPRLFHRGAVKPVIALVAGLWAIPAAPETSSEPVTVHRRADAAPVSILFGGDTYFGEHEFEQAAREGGLNLLSEKGYHHSLRRLAPLLAASDLVVLNLETPILYDRNLTPNRKSQIGYPVHSGTSPKTEEALRAAGVTAVSIANNHAMDFEEAGLSQTLASLDAAGIHAFGAGLNAMEAARPLRLRIEARSGSLDVFVVGGYAYRKRYDKQFGFYSSTEKSGVWLLEARAVSQQIREIRQGFPEALIIAFPHWGWNYAWKDSSQTRIARTMIEAGADLILGHGAHRLQEVQRYKGRWIIYSLGNFVFNTMGRYRKLKSPPFSLVARLLVEDAGDVPRVRLRLYPIVSDNTIVDFQPRPVDLVELGRLMEGPGFPLRPRLDEFGYFFQVNVWPIEKGAEAIHASQGD
ncbi:MAG: CapA family protein [Pseudomonadota bacterium]